MFILNKLLRRISLRLSNQPPWLTSHFHLSFPQADSLKICLHSGAIRPIRLFVLKLFALILANHYEIASNLLQFNGWHHFGFVLSRKSNNNKKCCENKPNKHSSKPISVKCLLVQNAWDIMQTKSLSNVNGLRMMHGIGCNVSSACIFPLNAQWNRALYHHFNRFVRTADAAFTEWFPINNWIELCLLVCLINS